MSDWDVNLIAAGSLPMGDGLMAPRGELGAMDVTSNVVLLRGGGRVILIDTAAGEMDSSWEGATSDLAGALARDGRLDDAADHAVSALEIIEQTRHAGSLRRVEELHREIAQSGSRAGRRLGEQLLYLKALS